MSGQDARRILPGAVVHPPVAHGDLLRLGLVRGDVVVIVDGYYHQSAPVRHKEILSLLANGVMVVGCASMGALRAAELARYGMIGNGVVFRMYRDGVLDADDEVAVAHAPAPDYRSFTVPSVVVRHAAGLAVRAGAIDEADAAKIVEIVRRMHYTDRSWRAIRHAADQIDLTDAAARLCAFVDTHPEVVDVKAEDALDTLRKIAHDEFPGNRHVAARWVSGDWRNRYLEEWQAECTISTVDEVEIGHGSIVRYQQLYLDDFPERWERFALRAIVGAEVADEELIDKALSKAAGSGLKAHSMSQERLRHWLTGRELAGLSVREALVRILVRSYHSPQRARDLILDQPELVEDDTARRMVAEATVVNAEVASWADKQTIDHLKNTALRAHLKRVWQVEDADPGALLAAARDRGFPSVAEASKAARMFFLHKSFVGADSGQVG